MSWSWPISPSWCVHFDGQASSDTRALSVWPSHAIVLGSLWWLCSTPHSTFCNYVSMSPSLLMPLTPLHSSEHFWTKLSPPEEQKKGQANSNSISRGVLKVPSFVKSVKKTGRSCFQANNLNSWPNGHSFKLLVLKTFLPVI